MNFSEAPVPQPATWTPPADAAPPIDGWKNNAIAVRARTLMLWALGILAGGLVVFSILRVSLAPYISLLALPLLTVGSVLVLSLIAIVFASIGLFRAGRLGGYRRGTALAALLGGIGALVFAVPISVLVVNLGSY